MITFIFGMGNYANIKTSKVFDHQMTELNLNISIYRSVLSASAFPVLGSASSLPRCS